MSQLHFHFNLDNGIRQAGGAVLARAQLIVLIEFSLFGRYVLQSA